MLKLPKKLPPLMLLPVVKKKMLDKMMLKKKQSTNVEQDKELMLKVNATTVTITKPLVLTVCHVSTQIAPITKLLSSMVLANNAQNLTSLTKLKDSVNSHLVLMVKRSAEQENVPTAHHLPEVLRVTSDVTDKLVVSTPFFKRMVTAENQIVKETNTLPGKESALHAQTTKPLLQRKLVKLQFVLLTRWLQLKENARDVAHIKE
jgi:hypothetical protein